MSMMVAGITLAEVAALIGDIARANILLALMDGRALTASELAWRAGVSAQTTSGHLSKLLEARLIALEKQGRHRYYRIAGQEVAHAVETLMEVAAAGPRRHRPVGPRDEALRNARTCYDHLAGRLGVVLTDSLCSQGHIVVGDGAGAITPAGERFLCDFGIDTGNFGRAGRAVCRTCLDWSERRPHLAGRLGAALCTRAFDLGWIERSKDSRAVAVTAAGRKGFTEIFGIRLAA
jgi:DNA-binding transcriptional ArsR family regulator